MLGLMGCGSARQEYTVKDAIVGSWSFKDKTGKDNTFVFSNNGEWDLLSGDKNVQSVVKGEINNDVKLTYSYIYNQTPALLDLNLSFWGEIKNMLQCIVLLHTMDVMKLVCDEGSKYYKEAKGGWQRNAESAVDSSEIMILYRKN
jgi:hypothetical protein